METSESTPKLHRYAISGVWGSAAKTLKRGDIVIDTYHGPVHQWEIRSLTTLAPAGGFKGRYLGIATCAGPGRCQFEGDHLADGTAVNCPNAACAEHHGEVCYALADITASTKESACTH